MSDPIAEAAANLNDAAPSSTEPVVAQEVGTAAPGESALAVDTPPSSPSAGESSTSPAEHPHTTILRSLTTTLRRKFNMLDGEIEAILKDAESHL